MIDCKTLAEKYSKDEIKDLSFFKKLEVKFHLLICPPCRVYLENIQSLKAGAKTIYQSFVKENKEEIEQIEKDV
jgi:hypothetical protein